MDEQAEHLANFFVDCTFPSAALSYSGINFTVRDSQRSELFSSMCSWTFSPEKHVDITAKHISQLLASLSPLNTCVLPSPTHNAARQNVVVLQQFALGGKAPPLDYDGLVSLNLLVKQKGLDAPIQADKSKAEKWIAL